MGDCFDVSGCVFVMISVRWLWVMICWCKLLWLILFLIKLILVVFLVMVFVICWVLFSVRWNLIFGCRLCSVIRCGGS